MGIFKDTYANLKKEFKERRESSERLRTKVQAEYNKAKEKETIKLARIKAKLEMKVRERQLREKYSAKPKQSFFNSEPTSGFGKPSPFFQFEPMIKEK